MPAPAPVPAPPSMALLKNPSAKKASIEEVEDLTRSVLHNHGGPDIKMLLSQLERSHVDAEKLEASWDGQRTEQLKWLSQMFDNNRMKDEWFLAAVALLDRAETARPRFSQKKSLKIDTLTAVLVIIKLYEIEDVFDCEIDALLPYLARDGSSSTWDEVVRAELTLYQLLDFHVCLPTVDEFAERIGLEMGILARDHCPTWRALKHVRFAAPGLEPSVPEPVLVVTIRFLIELCVVHMPELVYQSGSPAIVALAALRLAMEHFGDVPDECEQFLKRQEQELLKQSEADALVATRQKIMKLWQCPPQGSAVIAKWSYRVADSNASESTAGALGWLGPEDSPKAITPFKTPQRKSKASSREQEQEQSVGTAEKTSAAAIDASVAKAVAKVDGVDQRSSSTCTRLSGKSNGNARTSRSGKSGGNDNTQRLNAKSKKPGKPCSSNNKVAQVAQVAAPKKASTKRVRSAENQTPNTLEPLAKKVQRALPSLHSCSS